MWSDDPEQWKPLNHSCDPNTWLTGLDLVARRTIQPGEQITIDYATFCNETMAAFTCTCGAPNCRQVVRGDDHRQPFIEQYGVHVSDYVRRQRGG
jgi:D-alanine-D-alanine ligase